MFSATTIGASPASQAVPLSTVGTFTVRLW